MYVATVPNRGSPPAILLRESYRDGDKVKTRTLKNLSDWPAERIAVLRGDQLVPAGEGVAIEQALPHGHVVAALETARRIGLDRLLPRQGPQRRRDLALALIIARLLEPAAKLATARALDPATASHSLGAVLDLGPVPAKETYSALDWLGRQQGRIEAALARRHLAAGPLVLYDMTSTYLEGRCCPLAQYGYSRTGPVGSSGLPDRLRSGHTAPVYPRRDDGVPTQLRSGPAAGPASPARYKSPWRGPGRDQAPHPANGWPSPDRGRGRSPAWPPARA